MRPITKPMLCLGLLLVAQTVAANEALVESAKKEGQLVLYSSVTVDQAQKLNDTFRAKIPFLQISMFRAGDDYNKNYKQFRNIFSTAK